jgi:spermidine synthase
MKKLPHFLSFMMGFLSLSQEILWIRLVSFVNFGMPQAFAFTLTFYLLGIGLGALVGRKICAKSTSLYRDIVRVLLISALFDFAAPWLYAASVHRGAEVPLLAMLLVISALIKSILFPIVHQLGTDANGARIASSFARVYVSNILGSTLGPLVTGFFLLDLLPLQTSFMLLAWLVLAVAFATAVIARLPPYGYAGAALLAFGLAPFALSNSLLTMVANPAFPGAIDNLIENRNGVIGTVKDSENGDVVLGGNTYDGRINIDLGRNSNFIDRTFVSMALHPHPRRILMIGLSGGAWARIVSAYPDVKQVDVVEINPGYIELIRRYPEVEPVLRDPRFKIQIDDGRRWLKRHPDEKYDVVIMNTTYHWRAYTTNLVSDTFLAELRKHLNPGGLLSYNSTGSNDIVKTASLVFKHAYRYSNFVIASDVDFRAEWPNLHGRIAHALMALNRRATLTEMEEERLDDIDHAKIFTVSELEKESGRPLEIVTEQNMITEFKYGRSFLHSD